MGREKGGEGMKKEARGRDGTGREHLFCGMMPHDQQNHISMVI